MTMYNIMPNMQGCLCCLEDGGLQEMCFKQLCQEADLTVHRAFARVQGVKRLGSFQFQ